MGFLFPDDYRCNMLGCRFGSLAFLIWRSIGEVGMIVIYILQYTIVPSKDRNCSYFTFSWWTQTSLCITYLILIIAFSIISQQRKDNGDAGEDYMTIKIAMIAYEISWSGALFNFIIFLMYDLPVVSDFHEYNKNTIAYSIIISVLPMVFLAVDMALAKVSFVKIHFFLGLIYMTGFEICCIVGGYDIGFGFISAINDKNDMKTRTIIGIISGILGHDLMYLLTFLGGYSLHNVFKTKVEVRTTNANSNKDQLINTKRDSIHSINSSELSAKDDN